MCLALKHKNVSTLCCKVRHVGSRLYCDNKLDCQNNIIIFTIAIRTVSAPAIIMWKIKLANSNYIHSQLHSQLQIYVSENTFSVAITIAFILAMTMFSWIPAPERLN